MSVDRRHFLKHCAGLVFIGLMEPWNLRHSLAGAVTPANQSTRFFWRKIQPVEVTHQYPNKASKACLGMPGSVMKLLVTWCLLQHQLVPQNWSYECRGVWSREGHTVYCQQAHGRVTLHQALVVSCNGYFLEISKGLAPILLNQTLVDWGWLTPELGQERLIKTQRQFRLRVLGLDPAVAVSPLHLLSLAQGIAAQRLPNISSEGIYPERRDIWTLLQQSMRGVAQAGTGKACDPENRYQLALKTGTTPYGRLFQSWAMGYFPYSKPEYVFCLRSLRGTSQASAIPLLKKSLKAVFHW